jgi:hypothetical protein
MVGLNCHFVMYRVSFCFGQRVLWRQIIHVEEQKKRVAWWLEEEMTNKRQGEGRKKKFFVWFVGILIVFCMKMQNDKWMQ